MTIAVDVSSPTPVTSSGAATTTAAFTPPSASVIFAFCSADANNGSLDEQLTVTDSAAGTWNQAAFHNGNGGACSGIFWRLCPTSPGSITVSAADNKGTVPKRLTVVVFTGTNQTSPVGATFTGTTAASTYTSTQDQSWGWSCGLTANATLSAGGTGNTLNDTFAGFDSGDATFTLNRTTVTSPAGTGVTLTIAGTATIGHHVAVEILPPGGSATTTPGPIVVTPAVQQPMPRPLIQRSTLQDPPVLTTRQPLIVTTSVPTVVPRPPLQRATLADPPVLTAAQPYVVTQPARLTSGAVMTLRSSLVDATVVTGTPTPGPLLVTSSPKLISGPPVLLRSTLADPIPGTTPGPIVITPAVRPTLQPIVLLRSSLADPAPPAAATPGPLIVGTPYTPVLTRRPILRHGPAAAVLVTAATPQPLIVSSQALATRSQVLLLASPNAGGDVCDCLVHRPYAGTVARPFTGTVPRPCSCS